MNGRLDQQMRRLFVALAALLTLPLATAVPAAQAFSREGLPVEYLDVYSAAMNRSVRVEFESGGGKAVYLLDGLRAQDDYSDWYSPSTFNKQTYTYKWETFLTQELPTWLAANEQISTTGNGVVGLSMSGGAALILSAYHPAQFTYAASLSGFMNPSAPFMQQAIRVAMLDAAGYNVDNMWGPPADPAWKRNDPLQQVSRIAANGTRLWIYCAPGGATDVDAGGDPNEVLNANGLEGLAVKGNKDFQAAYVKTGGNNATFQFPAAGNHAWAYWGSQLSALKPDLIATLNG